MIHVSIHDVAPVFADEVREAKRICESYGMKPALLVVPDFHERAPLEEHPDFCAEVRAWQAEGHEIYLHGYTHRSRPAPPATAGRRQIWEWYFRQRVVSGGEAEFADLAPAEAVERLDRGLACLERCGFSIDGFVPPAWSLPQWALPLLGERGIRYTEEHLWIHQPDRGTQRRSLVYNWATRTAARQLSTVAFCRLTRPAIGLLPTRIAIHPGDLRSPLVVREIHSLLRAIQDRPIGTAQDLFAA
jgi:predicted deacetylase